MPVTTNRTLDKFEITSGRVRAFVASLPNGNLRQFVKDFAAQHPASQLAKLGTDYPGYFEVFPDHAEPGGTGTQLPLWLGAYPEDAMNYLDGCFAGPDSYTSGTYWQEPSVLSQYGVGYGNGTPDGTRKYGKDILDTKPASCIPPVLFAAFCAWDGGGELARTSDYYEVWGHAQVYLGDPEPFINPWDQVLRPGEFNYRNGHGKACPWPEWPGCVDATEDNPPPVFYRFPTGGSLADDETPLIGAPGRFPKDVTRIKSPDGGGWVDLGGNLLESAWPNTNLLATPFVDYCDTNDDPGVDSPSRCNRDQPAVSADYPAEARPGRRLFAGNVPPVALFGGSFEAHFPYGNKYFGTMPDDESTIRPDQTFPAHFQYGKLGGRCARNK